MPNRVPEVQLPSTYANTINVNPEDNELDLLDFSELQRRLIHAVNGIVLSRLFMEDRVQNRMKEVINELQGWKHVQAFSNLGGGVLGFGASALSSMVGGVAHSVFDGIVKASPLVANTIHGFADAKSGPGQFEKDQYLNTASLEKQRNEQLNNLKKEVQQTKQETERLKLQMFQRIQANQ